MGSSGFQTTFFDCWEPRQIKPNTADSFIFNMTTAAILCTDKEKHQKAFLFSFTLFRGRSLRYKLHKTDRCSTDFARKFFW